MGKRIAIVQGHPDPRGGHLCHAAAEAYRAAATAEGHVVRIIDVANADFPLLRTREEFEAADLPADIARAQDAIRWCEHMVVIYPLWLGTLPALLKGFLEQVFRYGFGMQKLANGRGFRRLLKGRSVRIIVTMGMPAAVYRWYFRAHGLKSLQGGVLSLAGFGPIRAKLIGSVEQPDHSHLTRDLADIAKLGQSAR